VGIFLTPDLVEFQILRNLADRVVTKIEIGALPQGTSVQFLAKFANSGGGKSEIRPGRGAGSDPAADVCLDQ
jgi:hypothetical protein